jgi:hypothetical protein
MQEEWHVVAATWAHAGAYVGLAGSVGEQSGLCLIISPDGLSFQSLFHGCSSSASEDYGVGTAALLLTDTGVVSVGAVAVPDSELLSWTHMWGEGSHTWQAWLPGELEAGSLPTTWPGYRVQLVPLVDSVLLVAVGNADPEVLVVFIEGPYPSG